MVSLSFSSAAATISASSTTAHQRRSRRSNISSIQSSLVRFIQCLVSFYFGVLYGSLTVDMPFYDAMTACTEGACTEAVRAIAGIQSCTSNNNNNMVSPLDKNFYRDNENGSSNNNNNNNSSCQCEQGGSASAGQNSNMQNDNNNDRRFPKTLGKIANGVARVKRDQFTSKFDMGVPLDGSNARINSEVLLLYTGDQAVPNEKRWMKRIAQNNNGPIPLFDVDDATANCDSLNIVLTEQKKGARQCMAIVGQYESYHVQKWMRVPLEGGGVNTEEPLRFVSRGYQTNGKQQFTAPTKVHVKKNWQSFSQYVNNLDKVLKQLKPVAEKVAKNNTIVVLTCNHGQSELLMNFACSARTRGLSLSNVLVFPTDKETMDLAKGLGLETFYDELNFGKMPTAAAKRYGDKNFVAMMFAKVYCVHMISMLGYDFLFQDVDVVWYRNPLEYFQDPSNPEYGFDMYFQEDGARSVRYAPYSANSGFYFVRNNKKTQYFFHSLLTNGDLIYLSDSHQQALIATMNEHTSLYGLKVKVLSRDTAEFPGGYHYHRRKDFMKDLIANKTETYIFHMSWTFNKDNKLNFFRQLGDWYLKDTCISKTAQELVPESGGAFDLPKPNDLLVQPCCSATPIITCHYQDKPSKIPCPDAPFIDKSERKFWT